MTAWTDAAALIPRLSAPAQSRISATVKRYQALTGTDARLVVRMIGDEPRFALVAR